MIQLMHLSSSGKSGWAPGFGDIHLDERNHAIRPEKPGETLESCGWIALKCMRMNRPTSASNAPSGS